MRSSRQEKNAISRGESRSRTWLSSNVYLLELLHVSADECMEFQREEMDRRGMLCGLA